MRQRGVYEKAPGSGVWWVRYADAMGRIRREKAGTKGSALTLYRKRKTESLQGKKLPENLRSPIVSFAELAQDTLAYSKAHKRSYDDDVIRMEKLLVAFRARAADSITPHDVERHLAQAAEESNWKPATVNRYRADIPRLSIGYSEQQGERKSGEAREASSGKQRKGPVALRRGRSTAAGVS